MGVAKGGDPRLTDLIIWKSKINKPSWAGLIEIVTLLL